MQKQSRDKIAAALFILAFRRAAKNHYRRLFVDEHR